jgi:hypothetical protein
MISTDGTDPTYLDILNRIIRSIRQLSYAFRYYFQPYCSQPSIAEINGIEKCRYFTRSVSLCLACFIGATIWKTAIVSCFLESSRAAASAYTDSSRETLSPTRVEDVTGADNRRRSGGARTTNERQRDAAA